MIFMDEINLIIVNSTFENNNHQNFLYSSPFSGSLILQNVNLTLNNFSGFGIFLSGGTINATFKSFEFNENNFGMGSVFLISSAIGGNIAYQNILKFENNIGKSVF